MLDKLLLGYNDKLPQSRRYKNLPYTESIVKVSIAKIVDIAPETVIAVTVSKNEAMDMGVHFKSLPKVWRIMIKPGVKKKPLIFPINGDRGWSVEDTFLRKFAYEHYIL